MNKDALKRKAQEMPDCPLRQMQQTVGFSVMSIPFVDGSEAYRIIMGELHEMAIMEDVLREAYAGLQMVPRSACLCSGGFVCSPCKARAMVLVWLTA